MKYPILKKFSAEARAAAASRVYDQKEKTRLGPTYACENGLCVWGVLLEKDFPEAFEALEKYGFPTSDEIMEALGYRYAGLPWHRYHAIERQIEKITRANDRGELATPEAVAALFAED